MKQPNNIFILILLVNLLSIRQNVIAQESIKVKGEIHSIDSSFQPFSYVGVSYTKYLPNGEIIYTHITVDSLGNFSEEFPKGTKIELSTDYDDYYSIDTTLYLDNLTEVKIALKVKPKVYIYTKQRAKEDIKNKVIQLITYDTLIYELNKKYQYTENLSFKYILLKKPSDYQFERKISEYNWAIQDHLFLVDSFWLGKLKNIEDSLIHLDSDNYAKEHFIDLNKISLTKLKSLNSNKQDELNNYEKSLDNLLKKYSNDSLSKKISFILSQIDNNKNYSYLRVAHFWFATDYENLCKELIKRITDKKEIGLTNSADLIIWERVASKDLEFYGHGGIEEEDLFTIAGRANYLLKIISGENFGTVSMYSTKEDLIKLQNRWKYWFLKLSEQK